MPGYQEPPPLDDAAFKLALAVIFVIACLCNIGDRRFWSSGTAFIALLLIFVAFALMLWPYKVEVKYIFWFCWDRIKSFLRIKK
jgi:hypothetical protein